MRRLTILIFLLFLLPSIGLTQSLNYNNQTNALQLFSPDSNVPYNHFRNIESTGDWVLKHAGNRFHFQSEASNGNEVLTLNKNGRVGIGTSDPQVNLHIKYSGFTSNYAFRQEGSTGHYWNMSMLNNDLFLSYDGITKGGFDNVTGDYTPLPDKRIKKNIQSLESVLGKVMQLLPSTYQFKDSPDDAPFSIGFITQVVEPLFPVIVSENNGYKGLSYSAFGVIAIKAIQEQQEIINDLEQQLKDEQKTNQSQQTQINRLKEQVLEYLKPMDSVLQN